MILRGERETMESRSIPSGIPIQVDSEPVELGGGLKGHPCRVVLLTGGVCFNKSQMGGWFVIDLETVIVTKEKLTATYNHESDEVIGRSESWEVTDEGLVLQTYIIPFKDDDRASEVIARSLAGTQYEASPDTKNEKADIERVPEGESRVVNGREVAAPEGGKLLRIYRNLPVLAYAICPIATDGGTTVTMLKAEEPMADDELKDQETTDEGGGSEYNANPELEAKIAEYGLDLGVEFFRKGLSDEEAKDAALKILREENAQLKGASQKLAREDPPKDEGGGDPPANPEPEDEQKQLKADVAKLKSDNSKLFSDNAKLSAEFAKLKRERGETEPLSMSGETPEEKKESDPINPVDYYKNQAANAKPASKRSG